ncbi:hypothetical protein Poli38472_009432 [Pythium oligandrum]|uniref:CCT domain-containing protein n=1 Tax=Pythium oligandrum TaxID=41045 RepID=A0A8K1FIR0_PYTOL|nr:hypothetical protein Poli38472_009432 [Pythium oligandrum]|eukprot:TMW65265.1 hypothetical protein Poli38472_009432 [Pythium oligandrum]
MLLSRKHARDAATESPLLRGPQDLPDENWRLRDLVDAGNRAASSGELVELLNRLNQRQSTSGSYVTTNTLESRAQLSSQELFLSVVMEWQRSPEAVRLQTAAQIESPTDAVFRHDQSFRQAHDDASSASSVSSYSSSEDDQEGQEMQTRQALRQMKNSHDVSPSSVHIVPDALPPLNLNAHESSAKRIGVYTPRARQELLRKYMAKRARRLSQNKVRYGVRKTLANARPRVKGRFVKTEQPLTAALVQSMKPSSA